MPETIKGYLETVAEQIRWKRARPVLVRELEQHLEDQRDDFIKEGRSPEEAERLAVRDMGDPVTVGAELDAVHRPRPQWGLLGLTIALALAGAILRVVFLQDLKSLASVGLGTAAMLGMYFLDISRLARHARALYIVTLLLAAAMLWWGFERPYSPPDTYFLLYYLAQCLPVLYALWLHTWRRKGWNGVFCTIAGGIPLVYLCMIHDTLANLSQLLLCGLVLTLLAVRQDWFGVGRRRSLCVVLGAALTVLARLFSLGCFGAFLGRLQIALHPELDPYGKGFTGWMMQMCWKDIRPLQNYPGTFDISGVYGIRGPDGREHAILTFGHDFLPAALAQSWGWMPYVLLLAVLAALLGWLLVKGLQQKYLLGLFVVLAVVITLAGRTLFSLALNFGVVLSSASLPLVVGNLQTMADMALIGLALSVFRGESIGREEPAEPLRPRKRLRIQVKYQ